MYGKNEILKMLDEAEYEYELFEHDTVFTVAQAQELGLPHKEAATKNLFLRDKKKHNYFIVSTWDNKAVDLRLLRDMLGTSALSFASKENLEEMLGLVPGAVSPFGALNDREKKVKVYIDRLFEGQLMDAHPNDNSATIFLKADDVIELLTEKDHQAAYIDLP